MNTKIYFLFIIFNCLTFQWIIKNSTSCSILFRNLYSDETNEYHHHYPTTATTTSSSSSSSITSIDGGLNLLLSRLEILMIRDIKRINKKIG